MTTDELIRELRIYADWFTDESETHCTIHEAADRLESLKKENTFLKAMQRQMADGAHDIGAMVENALKKGGQ